MRAKSFVLNPSSPLLSLNAYISLFPPTLSLSLSLRLTRLYRWTTKAGTDKRRLLTKLRLTVSILRFIPSLPPSCRWFSLSDGPLFNLSDWTMGE